MRLMIITVAAALLAAPLSAQAGPPAADAWRRTPVPDARLRVEFADAAAGAADGAIAARMSLGHMLLVGFTSGCVSGLITLPLVADEMPTSNARFLGCILGGAAGGFLAGVYGVVTGAD